MRARKGRHLARRQPGNQATAVLAVMALAFGMLVVPATAGATVPTPYGETIWQIGVDDDGDGSKDEFFVSYPDYYVCDNPGSTTYGTVANFVVGTTDESMFPGLGRASDGATTYPEYRSSCNSVTIEFTVTDTWADSVLEYGRMGGEDHEVYFDGVRIDDTTATNPRVDPHVSVDYFFIPGGIFPGTHYITIVGMQTPEWADGYNWNDYVRLTGNRAPTVDVGDADGPFIVPLNTNLPIVISEPDSGDSVTGSTCSATGDSSAISFATDCSSFTVNTVGVYQVTATATDTHGAVGAETEDVVVYDPTAGFVTGGGWFDSPAGAVNPSGIAGDGVVNANPDDGWFFNAEPPYVTPADFTEDEASIGNSSLGVDPILNTDGNEKFILRYVPPEPVKTADFDQFSIDFLIDDAGTNFSANQFYVNVYTLTPDPYDGSWYDCRFDYVAVTGSTTDWTTLTVHQATPKTAGAANIGSCPDSIAGMPADSTLLFISVNLGDTSSSDAGIGGYFDNAQLRVAGINTVWDFEKPDTVNVTGKANFGFVSKYKKGQTVPEGNTVFTFSAAGIELESTSYDWLIVNQGDANAQFKGSALVNEVPGYQFMVWAGDGEPDTIRIKIWEEATGTVTYDNGDTALGGGSIVIHSGKGNK